MKARYSPFVTRREASWNDCTNCRCRGPSLSKANPLYWWDARNAHRFSCSIDRVEGIAGEHMLDVGDDQFLMLLFMMQAKRNDGRELCQPPLIELLQQLKHALIDVPAVGIRLLDGRSRDQPTFGSAVPFSQRVVVRVKKVRVLWMKRLVIRNCRKEQEGLEKPADVGEMPLGRADIWHGLNDVIFGNQWFAQVLSKVANALVPLYEIR